MPRLWLSLWLACIISMGLWVFFRYFKHSTLLVVQIHTLIRVLAISSRFLILKINYFATNLLKADFFAKPLNNPFDQISVLCFRVHSLKRWLHQGSDPGVIMGFAKHVDQVWNTHKFASDELYVAQSKRIKLLVQEAEEADYRSWLVCNGNRVINWFKHVY